MADVPVNYGKVCRKNRRYYADGYYIRHNTSIWMGKQKVVQGEKN